MSTRTYPLDSSLEKLRVKIRKYAVDYGLDFFEVIFEVCDYEIVNILAAQGGFPSRYPHWRFGMEYEQLTKGYAYGLQKIYEMVINTDPCYAYLLKANHIVDQKIVMAHVYGHSDFFKNNYWFKHTNRNMMDVMANHRTKIRRYMDKYGQNIVENFIDKVLSIENLVDVHDLFETPEIIRKRREINKKADLEKNEEVNTGDQSTALNSFLRNKTRHEKNKKVTRSKIEKDTLPPKFPPRTPKRYYEVFGRTRSFRRVAKRCHWNFTRRDLLFLTSTDDKNN